MKIQIETHSWYKSKKSGNPHFWAICLLPEFQIYGDKNNKYDINLSWLFWTFSIIINDLNS